MNRPDLTPDLDQLGDALRAAATTDLAHQPDPAALAAAPARSRLRRPRVLAGGSLGLAGAAAAAVFAFGGTAATSPAFAISKKSDGTVLVKFNMNFVHEGNEPYMAQADTKLRSEYDETFTVGFAAGPAPTSGPIDCVPSTTIDENPPTPVKVLLGDNGTEMDSTGNTGTPAGPIHISSCTLYNDNAPSGNTGDMGADAAGNTVGHTGH